MTPQALVVWDALQFRTPAMLRIAEALPEAAWYWWPPAECNSIAWLVWHIAEVEDNWLRRSLLGLPNEFPFGRSVRETPRDAYPGKAAILRYFHDVRAQTRERLEATPDEAFDRTIDDPHYGRITVRQFWSGVLTSCAWHAGQVAVTARLAPPELKHQ